MLGVQEYFLYDPLASICSRRCKATDCRRVSLSGYCLKPKAGLSAKSGPGAAARDGRLRVFNPATGERLLTPPRRYLSVE